MYQDKTILIDVSRYQKKLDYKTLQSNGIVCVIAKAAQGDYLGDPQYPTHANSSHRNGMSTGAYMWVDPMCDDNKQAAYFMSVIASYPVDFVAVDIEQYWQNWSEWAQHNIKKIIPPERISESAYRVAQKLKVLGLPILIYTRTSFMVSWARPMLEWVVEEYDGYLWLATYPYSRTTVTTTWEQFRDIYYPKTQGPVMPPGAKKPALWQCSGDKFILPGTGGSKIDIDLWPGTVKSFWDFAKHGIPPEPPPPDVPQLPATAELQYALKTHRSPDTFQSSVNGGLTKGVLLPITEVVDNSDSTMGKISPNLWVALISRGVKLANWKA